MFSGVLNTILLSKLCSVGYLILFCYQSCVQWGIEYYFVIRVVFSGVLNTILVSELCSVGY